MKNGNYINAKSNNQMNSYHNTTNESGATLKQSNKKAMSQDEQVFEYFKSCDYLGATPERVLRHFKIMEKLSSNKWHNTPVTSVRRSFSNLKNKGLIYKSDVQVMGDYGKLITVWRLSK